MFMPACRTAAFLISGSNECGKVQEMIMMIGVLECIGSWQVAVTTTQRMVVAVQPAEIVTVDAETIAGLPDFKPTAAGWVKGVPLAGVRAQECAVTGALDPASLRVEGFERGVDYEVDLQWGTIGRLPAGRIAAGQPVVVRYRYGKMRLDSVVARPDGSVAVVQGIPDVVRPLPPTLAAGETRMANILIPARAAQLTEECLFPILETGFPEVPVRRFPATLEKLRRGEPVRILAWGDSVTDAGYLPGKAVDRWQDQFVTRLRERFPTSRIELVTEAWGGRNTGSYLAEPPGSLHNYQERVLAVKPDLIISEFVNDAGLNAAQVNERYGQLLKDFRGIGAEWIILTPHYVRPDWMGLTRQREIDEDPRPYVKALREFAEANGVPLADAAWRWGRLWRQGLPYLTLMHNNINHPDARGMKLFADSLLELFPASSLVSWPAPDGEPPSPHFALAVEGAPVFVYRAPVRAEIWQKDGLWSHHHPPAAEEAGFAIFDLRGPATVVVRPTRPFKTAAVLPARTGISPVVADGTVRFQITEPRHLTVVLDGTDAVPLHLFVSRPEVNAPRPDDPNVIYFGPGVHDTNGLEPKSGQTVYLAGGAVVRLRPVPGDEGVFNEKWKVRFTRTTGIRIGMVSDVRVCGRGILDASAVPHPGGNMIPLDGARNVRLEGITLRDAANWNVRIAHSENITVENLRILSARLNSDGINSVNSRAVSIRHCFVRNSDDSIVAKTVVPDAPCEDVEVADCVVWSDWGYALGATYETRSLIRRVRFRRCDILFVRHWALGVHVSDGATVSDIEFADMDFEQLERATVLPANGALTATPKLVRMVVQQDVWGKDPERGQIRDIRFTGVTVGGGALPESEMAGADAGHGISNITFESVGLRDEPAVGTAADLKLKQNAYVQAVDVLPSTH